MATVCGEVRVWTVRFGREGGEDSMATLGRLIAAAAEAPLVRLLSVGTGEIGCGVG